MSADPWELLTEARTELNWLYGLRPPLQYCEEFIKRIDAALAAREKHAEPVARVDITRHGCIKWLKKPMSEEAPFLADWVPPGGLLYAAPPDSIPREDHDRLIREAQARITELEERLTVLLAVQLKRFSDEAPAPPAPI